MEQTLGTDQSLFSLSVSRERSELWMFFLGSYVLYKHSGHFQLRTSGFRCEAKISSLC